LKAGLDSVHWGWFDAAQPPALTVESGDRLVIETVSGGPANLPGPGLRVPPELLTLHDRAPRQSPGHILTGPVEIRGAEPGDVLEVRILDIQLRQDWGYTYHRPLAGALPLDFDTGEQIILRLDPGSMTGLLPWGTSLPLRPFFGVMGTAPPPGWGRISTIQPRAHGGNLDNKDLVAGTTLYLPVHAAGGLFSVGDGHGAQGDGEVCVTAIETALEGTFDLILHKRRGWGFPRAETPTHLISMGTDADLDTAARDALRRMIDWVCELTTLSRSQAYMLLSLAGDVRVTQLVNGEKGSHVMLEKSVIADVRRAPTEA
jgi:acetamidase/formamidase